MTYPQKEKRLQALRRSQERLRGRLAHLEQLNNRFTWLRLLTFLAGFLLSGALFFTRGPLPALGGAVVWFLAFAVVVAYHRRLQRAIARFQGWLALKEDQVARMTLDWEALPSPAPIPSPPAGHPFVVDLDLLGSRSLHQLLDTAVSRGGSLRLQELLLIERPQLTEVMRRQTLVRELRRLPIFRDKLRLQAMLASRGAPYWEAERLRHWLQAPQPEANTRRLLILLTGLAVLNAALFVLNQLGLLPTWWPYTLALYFLLYMALGRAAAGVFEESLALQAALQQTAAVFDFLERYRYGRHPALRALVAPFLQQDDCPSCYLRRIGRVVNAAGLSRNPMLWLLLNAIFPWDLFFAHRLHELRRALAGRLPGWLDVWFELEALSALANLGYLNPHYTFPTIFDPGRLEAALEAAGAETEPPFAGEQLGHPLIPDAVKVRNDFAIPALGQIDIITGSNMAGKSSFLRTLGVNLVLSYAGAPVDAGRLHTRLFRLFTCIRVTDSVTDGISYFYAEVKRLKALLQALRADEPCPLFFLIDEIFRGTNNRERLIGSRAYIRELAGEHGVGVIATHDLELIQLAEEMAQVRNYHFRDWIEDGRMHFDYCLRPGPSPTTNALYIMEREGLPVPAGVADGAPRGLEQGEEDLPQEL